MKEDLKQPECDCLSCQTKAVVLKDVSVDKQFKAPYKINIGIKDKPNYRAVKLPNQNITLISTIESLMSIVNDNLIKLKPYNLDEIIYQKQAGAKHRAFEEIDLFQKTTLFELRKAFE